ncbi:Por secretion system C-terminal sorting domain-containing protein [Polaribacter sp. Hel1_33_78]|uniref:T9SS type A sorting domain-containing protein n=1 Tax=Polaribacter sp. Hel1_33_78 TaxID=1336804 RepID=UPI00087A1F06|nr:T9SS type A sorting domain-containing protein [Polaribacter sp. Hel1_33_78]SDT97853.1 Por secretion system C-terminal sorting domain-containing protein [Polaribacter sp. Hel1_33_78]
MKKNTFLTICLSLFLVGGLFAQQTVYVSTNGAGALNGTSEADAYDDFVTALADIDTAGDILRVIGDMNVSAVSLNLKTEQFTIEGDAAGSTLTGVDAAVRMFTINGGTGHNITFKNLIFTGATNSTGGGGGGVLFSNQTSTLTFDNCVFNGNSVTSVNGGGAIFLGNAATLTATGCTFYENSSTSLTGKGGAIAFVGTGVSTITNCTFFENTITRNSNDYGAAIRIEGKSVTITNSLFYNNKVNAGAGGVADVGASAAGTQKFINSLGQLVNANMDEVTNSVVLKKGSTTSSDAADLDGSNLVWNETLNKVTFSAPNAIADLTIVGKTPINFGSDGNDVGAWEGSAINIFLGGTPGAVEGWANDANWSKGSQPEATDNVAILTGRNCNLPISTTVNDIKVTSLLRISSNQGLVVNGDAIVTGTVRYSRALTNNADNTKAWHLVASPVVDEVFDTSYLTINDIAVGTNSNRGIATYNTGDNSWSYYTGVDITATSGQGYSMKITPDEIESAGGEYADGIVVFEGTLNDTDFTTPALAAGFNLLGNPYTSFVNSGVFLGDAANSATGMDKTQMWVWNSSTENYDVKTVGEAFVLAPAQGFFVNSTNTAAVTFSKTNQATTGGAFQKTARTEIKLLMNTSTNERFAKIYLTDTATKGFDSGWEGEVFGGIANKVDVFTELVSDNQGKNYQVQSLPISEMESMVIPVGVIAEAGKELTFSLEQTNFPTDVKVYLEDRLANTYNELTNSKTFKVTLSEALNDVGRFYLHASKSSLSLDDNAVSENISMYKSNATTLKVVGLPNGTSNIKLFNILGKQVLNTSFTANGVKEITLPKLAIGVYIVQLETETSKLNKKIVIE